MHGNKSQRKPLHGGENLKTIVTLYKEDFISIFIFKFCKVAGLIKQWDAVGCCDSYIVSYSSLCGCGAVLCIYCQRFQSLARVVQA